MRPMIVLGTLSLLAAGSASFGPAPPSVRAQQVASGTAELDCQAESEPNDAPESLVGTSGAACLAGTLPPGDQDLFAWELAQADATSAWAIGVEGLPGARTIVDLRPVTSEPGLEPITLGGPLLALTTEPGAESPESESVLLAPGRYVVGVSAGGQSSASGLVGSGSLAPGSPESDPALAYRVSLEPGPGFPAMGDTEPNDEATTAVLLAGAFELSGDLVGSADLYRWTVPPDPSAAAWDLELWSQLGSAATLTLGTVDGSAVIARTMARDGHARLPDLALAAGDYLLMVDPPATAPTRYALAARAAEAPAGDPEPNDTQERAVPMAGPELVAKGRLGRDEDVDWYALSVSETLAAGVIDIRLVWRSDLARELCVISASGDTLLCRESSSGINVSGLTLPAGDHALRIQGLADPNDPYLLRVDAAGSAAPGFEREPNDTPKAATVIDPASGVRGRAIGADRDQFAVRVTGEPQLWQVVARGSGIVGVDWIRPNGDRLATASIEEGGSSATLTDLYLAPGEHLLRVEGVDGDYALELTPLGPPDPRAEREPNDLTAREERLVVGKERVGRLPIATDTDVYRHAVRGTDHLALVVVPPPDGEIDVLVADGISWSASLHASGEEPLRHDFVAGPGEVRVTLIPTSPSTGRYTIGLDRLDPFRLADDQEPNDSPRMARPLPASGTAHGTSSGPSDTDWYALPPSLDGAPVRVQADGDVTTLALHDGSSEQTLVAEADGTTYASTPVTPGVPLLLRVGATGPYRVSLVGASEPGAPAGPPLSLEVALAEAPLAAWWPTGQRSHGVIRLANAGTGDVDVALDALASDRTWRIDLPTGTTPVPAGGAIEVPIEVLAPADVPADEPVRLTVRARTADGAAVTGFDEVDPSREALPAEQVATWPIPDALLGGLDAASTALGAVPIPSLDPDGEARLHDGFAATDWGLTWPIGGLPVTLTVDLATDEPVPVAGTILHPLAEDLALGDSVRSFELALSTDGGTWQTVLSGVLDPVAVEQAFTLGEPVEARFAQLRVTSLQRETPSRIDLGEWKVVAAPGWTPAGGALDLADPHSGGHVAWLAPQAETASAPATMLDDDPAPVTLPVERGSGIAWVVGFMDDRAALVSSLEWRDPAPSDPSIRLERVGVQASTDGPLGPWRSLGTWRLERAADGSVEAFVPEAPAWARFLRLEGEVGPKQARVELPGHLRVLETPQDGSYRSVLGQWGMGEPTGPLEWSIDRAALPADDGFGGTDAPDAPRELEEGQVASGRVHFGRDADRYRLAVSDEGRTLALTVMGEPSVGAALTLHTEDGTRVPMTFGPGEVAGTVTYLASVEPGRSYLVEVAQPRSSVVVAFDTSASVATQLASIEAGLRSFAEGMEADREALRIVPFDDEPLLPAWSSDPYQIGDAVSRYVLGPSSSQVESNLRDAALDLVSREGSRAVLLITDAASSSSHESARMWAALAASRPRVFTVEVGGEGESPAIERHHLMADWAASSGGVASHARGGVEVQEAFDRLATHLRRPAAYSLTFETSPDELPPPAPGRISVVAAEVEGERPAIVGGEVAIAIVVDTSGSMLKRLGDARRIDVAKAVLVDLVREGIPEGALVALRTFTPQERSCETRLVTPLGPLDRDAMATTIEALEVPSSTRTPLAKAIAAVADDLAAASGPRIVVVVSDGKESCQGDPAEAVRQLRAQGLDVTVNVVGLALDRASRKTIAKLAGVGGGSYFDADDPESLGAALRAAVSAPVQVLDASGAVVARGTVGGEPLEVPPGTYRVVVATEPETVLEDVFVEPAADIELTIPVPEDAARR